MHHLLNAFRRKQGPKDRRFPVTMKMLRWLAGCVNFNDDFDATVFHASVFGWFFMTRVSELLVETPKDEHEDPGFRYSDVALLTKGDQVFWNPGSWKTGGWWQTMTGRWVEPPDSVAVKFRRTKVDKYGGAAVRLHGRSQDGDICPVGAAVYVEKRSPGKRHMGGNTPFWEFASGRPVKRTDIQAAVKAMVAQAGLPTRQGNTHSLRIGGATALYAAVRDMEVVKRWGRWRGDVAHLYVWDERSTMQNDARSMATAGSDVVAFMSEMR